MSICRQVMKDFSSFPNTVGKVAELLADGRSVCVILGDHEACTHNLGRFRHQCSSEEGSPRPERRRKPRLSRLDSGHHS